MDSDSGNRQQLIVELKAIMAEDGKRRSILGPSYATMNREHTLEEIGQVLGLTRERIRQIEKKAMRKIQLSLDKTILNDLA